MFGDVLKANLASSAVIGGVKVLGNAVKELGVFAIDSYANYEQLVGGIDTLFKNSAGIVSKYAAEAYKTAGMSANAYMETVTSFSASLIQSLGGDTELAAQKADQAITDMSDNANKMGTSIGMIQNAYQGFAKQNYTMLDNLKLGYGGTIEEMQRLLVEAEKISGIEYDISNYADVVDAIHVIQTEMGITGTTALEASETIAGSAASMKASWENLVIGLGDENADLTQLVGQFVDSVITYGNNLIPRVGVIIKSVGTVIAQEVPKLIQKIPTMVGDILPDLSKSFGELFKNALSSVFGSDILSGLSFDGDVFSGLFDQLKGSILDNFSGALDRLGEAFSKVTAIIQPFVESYLQRLNTDLQLTIGFISDVFVPALGFLFDAFMDIVNVILDAAAPAIENIRSAFEGLYLIISEAVGTHIIPTLNQFVDMIARLWTENRDHLTKLGTLFSTVFNTIAGIVQWFVGVVEQYIYPLFIWIVSFVQEHMDQIQAIFQSVFDIIGGIIDFFIALFQGNWEGMWNAILSILNSGVELVMGVFGLFRDFIGEIVTFIAEKLIGIWEAVKESWNSFVDYIISFAQGIYDTLIAAWESIVLFFTESIPQFIASIIEWLGALPEQIAYLLGQAIGIIAQWGIDLIDWAVTNIPLFVETIVTFIAELPDKVKTLLANVLANVVAWAGDMLVQAGKAARDFVEEVRRFIAELPGKVAELLTNVITEVISFAANMAAKATEAGQGFFNNIVSVLSGIPGRVFSIGQDIVSGIWNGISSGWSWLVSQVQGLADSLIQGVKSTLKINSPSKEFQYIGEMCVAGFEEGSEGLMDPAQITRNTKASLSAMRASVSGAPDNSTGGGSGFGVFNQTINVNREISTPDELARTVRVESKYGLMRGLAVGY